MLTYEQILTFCIQVIAAKDDKSDEVMAGAVENFSTQPAFDRDRLLADLKSHFSVFVGEGAFLVDESHEPWLDRKKAIIDPFYWDRYKLHLMQQGFATNALDEMDKSTDRILGLLDDPERPGPWDRRGMVLGHVQSGKTAHYTGLINKAADAGYKVIIIVAGIHNNLRNQTQRRIDEGFRGIASADIKKGSLSRQPYVGVGTLNPDRQPSSFTTTLKDFNKAAAQQVGVPMSNMVEPAVFVIKKNQATLRSLIDWLRQYSGVGMYNRIDEPLLLIDDEADNASINTSTDPHKATRINSQIRELLEAFGRSAYVGYTATPFANIFVDPDTEDEMIGRDLFPRDFLVSLDAPSNYLGPTTVFDGSELSSYLRSADDAETFIPIGHKSDFVLSALPPSLEKAIRAFVLTRAIRILRGQGKQHSSMLINVTHLVKPQRTVEKAVRPYLRAVQEQVKLYGNLQPSQAAKYAHIAALEETFREEFSHLDVAWADVYPQLWESISPIQVVTINSGSADALDYEHHNEDGLHVIAVGGYSLSRGLTLEGLTISYLSRNSKQYDTLMQMGRWFGYRPGYQDLCRIWLPDMLAGWYEHITEATEELRSDLVRMQQFNATPRDFGLRVRSHPETLLVTARNKMGSSQLIRVQMSLTKTFVETARLANNEKAMDANRRAAFELTQKMVSDQEVSSFVNGATRVFQNVTADHIVAFLRGWINLDASYRTNPDPLIEYIQKRSDELGIWDVAFPSVASNPRVAGDDYSAIPITMQQRTVGRIVSKQELQIGSKLRVMSRSDEALGLSESEKAAARSASSGNIILGPQVREHRSRPLMLVHYLDVLDKEQQSLYEAPVIAWSISFPASKDPGDTVEYLVNSTYVQEYLPGVDTNDSDENDLT